MLFERSSAVMAMDAYVAAYSGDPSGLWLMSFVARYIFPEIVNWGDSSSKAISADGDPARDYDRDLMPEGALIGSPLGRFLWRPLDKWPIKPIPEWLRHVQPSNVETLIISGNLDFSTPAENATRDLLPNLSNGVQVILSDVGHIGDLWGLQPDGTHRLVTSFIETGVADSSLLRHIPMDFDAGWGYPLIAKLLVASVMLILALLVGGVSYGIRRRRRRFVLTRD